MAEKEQGTRLEYKSALAIHEGATALAGRNIQQLEMENLSMREKCRRPLGSSK